MNIENLIEYLEHHQTTDDEGDLPGLFISNRVHRIVPYSRKDDNIFFSGLIAFTLQQLKPQLTSDLQYRVQGIIDGVRMAIPYYQHWKGEGSYNFWRTGPSQHFPNGFLLKNLGSMELPDDADDSVIMHLVMDTSREQRQWLKDKLEMQYPDQAPLHLITPKVYQDLRGYPTFLGKNIPREMDCCVLSNVLYFVLDSKLKITSIDHDSIEFLCRVLLNRDFRLRPFHVSPNYASPAVILYHMTRLAAKFPIHELNQLRELLHKVLLRENDHQAYHWMEKLLISISQRRLGLSAQVLISPDDLEHELDHYAYFRAGMLTSLGGSFTSWAHHPFFHLHFKCPAYNRTLLLEHLVLKNSVTPDHSRSW